MKSEMIISLVRRTQEVFWRVVSLMLWLLRAWLPFRKRERQRSKRQITEEEALALVTARDIVLRATRRLLEKNCVYFQEKSQWRPCWEESVVADVVVSDNDASELADLYRRGLLRKVSTTATLRPNVKKRLVFFDLSKVCSHRLYVKILGVRSIRPQPTRIESVTAKCSGSYATVEFPHEEDALFEFDATPENASFGAFALEVSYLSKGKRSVAKHSFQLQVLDDDDEEEGNQSRTKERVLLAPLYAKKKDLIASSPSEWRRLAQSGLEVHLQIGALLSKAEALYPWDDARRDYRVYVEPLEIRGIQNWLLSSALGPISSHFHLSHLLTVRAKVSSEETKTKAQRMDHTTCGCVFPKEGRLTLKVRDCKRSQRSLHLALSRRLATDVVDTETLGNIEVSLKDIPVFSQQQPCMTREVTFRRHKKANGTLRVRLWMEPEENSAVVPSMFAAFTPLQVALSFAVALAVLLRLFYFSWSSSLWLASPIVFCALAMELPTITGRLLTDIIEKAVPGLNLKFGALRFFLYLVKKEDDRGRRELVFAVDLDDFRLQNDPDAGYFYDDFLSASRVKFSIVLDLALLQRSLDLASLLLRRLLLSFFKERRRRHNDPKNDGAPTHVRLSEVRLDDFVVLNDNPIRLRLIGLRDREEHETSLSSAQRVVAERLQTRTIHHTEAAWPTRHYCSHAWSRFMKKFSRHRVRPTGVGVEEEERFCQRTRATFCDLDVDYSAVLEATDGTGLVKIAACQGETVVARSSVIRLHGWGNNDIIDLPFFSRRRAKVISSSRNTSREDVVGRLRCRLLFVVKPSLATALINWSPFPSVHAALRKKDGFEASRLATLIVRELCVEKVSLAFDIASGEFNVCRLARTIADGKVRRKLPKKFKKKPPNTLRVRVIAATGCPTNKILRVKVSVRDVSIRTNSQRVYKGACIWNHSMTLPCPDASAVLHVQVYEDAQFGKLVGQWMTTAKMLALDPTNVFGRDLVAATDECSFRLRGSMVLRDKKWLPIKTKASTPVDEAKEELQDDSASSPSSSSSSSEKEEETDDSLMRSFLSPEMELELEWFHDAESGLTQDQVLAIHPKTALEQLQQNALETSQKLGNLGLVTQMLTDFPLLFDLRALEVSHVNFYLKPLFVGYRGAGDQDDNDDTSSSSKKHTSIYVGKIDLRDALDRSALGCDLAKLTKLLVSSLVKPVLSEVSFYKAGKHILSGLYVGLFSSSSSKISMAAPLDLDDLDSGSKNNNNNDIASSSTIAETIVKYSSIERYKFLVDAWQSDVDKYLTWRGQLDLLTPAPLKGLLLRRRVSLSSAKRLRAVEEEGDEKTSSMMPFWSSNRKKRTTMELVWCEIHGSHLYYTRVQPNGQSRVGFTKIVDLRALDTAIGRGRDGEVIVRYSRGSRSSRNVVLLPFSPREPSTHDWHGALLRARDADTLAHTAALQEEEVVTTGCMAALLDNRHLSFLYCGSSDDVAPEEDDDTEPTLVAPRVLLEPFLHDKNDHHLANLFEESHEKNVDDEEDSDDSDDDSN